MHFVFRSPEIVRPGRSFQVWLRYADTDFECRASFPSLRDAIFYALQLHELTSDPHCVTIFEFDCPRSSAPKKLSSLHEVQLNLMKGDVLPF